MQGQLTEAPFRAGRAGGRFVLVARSAASTSAVFGESLTVQRSDGSALMTVNDASNRKYSYRATGICRIDG